MGMEETRTFRNKDAQKDIGSEIQEISIGEYRVGCWKVVGLVGKNN